MNRAKALFRVAGRLSTGVPLQMCDVPIMEWQQLYAKSKSDQVRKAGLDVHVMGWILSGVNAPQVEER